MLLVLTVAWHAGDSITLTCHLFLHVGHTLQKTGIWKNLFLWVDELSWILSFPQIPMSEITRCFCLFVCVWYKHFFLNQWRFHGPLWVLHKTVSSFTNCHYIEGERLCLWAAFLFSMQSSHFNGVLLQCLELTTWLCCSCLQSLDFVVLLISLLQLWVLSNHLLVFLFQPWMLQTHLSSFSRSPYLCTAQLLLLYSIPALNLLGSQLGTEKQVINTKTQGTPNPRNSKPGRH